MTADGKIGEAERWLDKIKNSEHRKDRTELKDNVSAFLNCANSIPDHLLEEYNQKFEIPKILTLNTNGLHGKRVQRLDYGVFA